MTYAARYRPDRWLGPGAFARATGLHPELVRRLVALGLLDAAADAAGRAVVPPRPAARPGPDPAAARRVSSSTTPRIGLVIDLLDRIAELETALRDRPTTA